MSSEEPRIVIRRGSKAKKEAPHGGWKIAYADFMTAMMAFFLVMWLLSLIPREELSTVAEYFRTPLVTAITGGQREDRGESIIPGGQPSIIPNPNPNPATQPSDSDGTGDGDARDQERLEDLKSELENLIQTDPVLMQFRPQLLLDMTPEGLRVQIIDRDNRPMFATGSAQVQPYMRDILRELGPIFNELPNTLSISGHTDSTPFLSGGRSYGNWELSGDRANSARRELISGGMDQSKVKRVLGLADTVSLVDNPADAMNRRISIIVLNRKTERLIDQQNQSLQPGTPVQNLTSPTGVVPAPVIPAIPGLPAPAATP